MVPAFVGGPVGTVAGRPEASYQRAAPRSSPDSKIGTDHVGAALHQVEAEAGLRRSLVHSRPVVPHREVHKIVCVTELDPDVVRRCVMHGVVHGFMRDPVKVCGRFDILWRRCVPVTEERHRRRVLLIERFHQAVQCVRQRRFLQFDGEQGMRERPDVGSHIPDFVDDRVEGLPEFPGGVVRDQVTHVLEADGDGGDPRGDEIMQVLPDPASLVFADVRDQFLQFCLVGSIDEGDDDERFALRALIPALETGVKDGLAGRGPEMDAGGDTAFWPSAAPQGEPNLGFVFGLNGYLQGTAYPVVIPRGHEAPNEVGSEQ